LKEHEEGSSIEEGTNLGRRTRNNSRDDEGQRTHNNVSYYKAVLLPLKFSYFHNHFFFRINRELYPLLEDSVTESFWKDFCSHLDGALQQVPALKRSRSRVSCLKIPCFLVGIALTVVYWNAMYWQYFATSKNQQALVAEPIEPWLYYGLLVTLCMIGTYIFFRMCFVTDSAAERKTIHDIQQVCDRFSGGESNVEFNLKFTNDVFRCWWWCRGGLSCARENIDSIRGIECIIYNRPGDATEFGDPPAQNPPSRSAPTMPLAEGVFEAHIVEEWMSSNKKKERKKERKRSREKPTPAERK